MAEKSAVEVVTSMLERKRRTLSRKTEEAFEVTHPYDAVGKAVTVAGIQGAIDVLEELLVELAGVESLTGA